MQGMPTTRVALTAFLLTGALGGCATQSASKTALEKRPFWALEYTVRPKASDSVAVSYGWQFVPIEKDRIYQHLDESDQKRAEFVLQSVLENNPTGTASGWDSPTTGHSGRTTPTRTFRVNDDLPCRDFTTLVNIGGDEGQGYGRFLKEDGTACRDPSGVWIVGVP